jgi:competence protein ComEC
MRLLVLFAFLILSTITIQAQVSAHYINIGQGDSILIEMKSAAILIDAGGEATGDTSDRDHLVEYLNTFFARRPDLNKTLYSVIISHPHLDHTKNLMAVMENFTVLNLVDGGNKQGSGISQLNKARQFVTDHDILYNRIDDADIGRSGYTTSHLRTLKRSASEADVRFLAGSRGCKNANNDSLVVLLRYKDASYLFVGDAEIENDSICRAEIPELIDFYRRNKLLDVDVYKVGHHGSHNGTSEAFMQAMTPEISVLSTGIHTRHEPGQFHAFQFGHPREVTVALLESLSSSNRDPVTVYSMNAVRDVNLNRAMSKAVYCTCWDGDVVVAADASGGSFTINTTGQ